jgi:hypothetical protein
MPLALAALSFPGRNPASVSSFARCVVAFFAVGLGGVCAIASVLVNSDANSALLTGRPFRKPAGMILSLSLSLLKTENL